MGKEYIVALRESLEKKLKIMEETYSLCKLQSDVLESETVDFDRFDQLVDEKDICIDKISKLDEGFELVYQRVQDELLNNKDAYSSEIKKMQELITKITDYGTRIMALEERNKKKVTSALNSERLSIREGRRSVNVAMNYYKGMTGMGIPESRFMDKKH